MKVDLKRLDELVDMMEARELQELEVIDGESMICLELQPPKGRPRISESELEEPGVTITASRVGIYLHALSVGQAVKVGDPVGEIRVMDVKYRVASPSAGTVAEIFVEDGLGVEYGQPLVRLMPADAE